jgi:hypothetical protein
LRGARFKNLLQHHNTLSGLVGHRSWACSEVQFCSYRYSYR